MTSSVAHLEGGDKCHDELRKKCGKQIDDLKNEIQHTSIIGTIKGAVDVVECIVNNAEDLWNHCKPSEKSEVAAVTCQAVADATCPEDLTAKIPFAAKLSCLGQHGAEMGWDCTTQSIYAEIVKLEESDNQECHIELRKKCGKQIDQLKKEIEQNLLVGIFKSAVDVVDCVAINAEDLWKHCNPLKDTQVDELVLTTTDDYESNAEVILKHQETPSSNNDDSVVAAGAPTPPTRKPTRKPTKKPTRKPTHKPTHKPTVKPTRKPTRKPSSSIESIVPTTKNHMMEETENSIAALASPGSVTLNMDLCMEAAQEFCGREVVEFNDSPFDENLMIALDGCVRAHATEIQAKCAVQKERKSMWSRMMGPPPPHAPCRHPEDELSNLPVCEPEHHCAFTRFRPHGVVIAAIIFLAALVSASCCCFVKGVSQRRYLHVAQEEVPADGEPILNTKVGYQPIGQQQNMV